LIQRLVLIVAVAKAERVVSFHFRFFILFRAPPAVRRYVHFILVVLLVQRERVNLREGYSAALAGRRQKRIDWRSELSIISELPIGISFTSVSG
jgi:hypothetical protein